ncbi:MAG: Alanyl-tRNA editing protein AlaX-M [Candidatus Methanofastidiosum methylothiophilum]|uniref:Alanyl-tRNA editing protein AlaX-M n=1 Tax=Candidatus Methanofastidiosum methylothiophilum TaxID=1705564 RepID=A0A150IT92_9EURY|nr:MAG: Alanyl-tRNA editing protein AlaX-M [Candidatus Methanofastidiosum methylthiophilus]KYC48183.1 MAG: Alanyl-tRNA editing protein AlaX-M [Candidatus Methanofastidiosum methylthiophilus]KYC50838.1 MAG: Alanyl-tRNA editing protein AlaX-M [Candidatus Methanofastidiosum methylthiophilus]
MADCLYTENSYLKEFDAKVTSAKGKYIILDKTSFYPNSGGVEWDTGKISNRKDGKVYNVIYVGKFEGDISHEIDKEGLNAGDEVHCVIDWERRYKLMRYHTAAHLISGIFNRKYNLLITGNQLTPDKGRIDLNMEKFDIDFIKKIIDEANEFINKDLSVDIYYKDIEEAKKDPSLFKLAVGFPHEVKNLRIVDIRGFDAQADGGCHVKSLKEIGKITFLEAINKGKNNRRIYFILED